MDIKCTVKKYENPSSKILAVATVELATSFGALVLEGYKVIQGTKAPWCAPPSEYWKSKKGEPMNRVLVKAPANLAAEIAKKIMDEFNAPTDTATA